MISITQGNHQQKNENLIKLPELSRPQFIWVMTDNKKRIIEKWPLSKFEEKAKITWFEGIIYMEGETNNTIEINDERKQELELSNKHLRKMESEEKPKYYFKYYDDRIGWGVCAYQDIKKNSSDLRHKENYLGFYAGVVKWQMSKEEIENIHCLGSDLSLGNNRLSLFYTSAKIFKNQVSFFQSAPTESALTSENFFAANYLKKNVITANAGMSCSKYCDHPIAIFFATRDIARDEPIVYDYRELFRAKDYYLDELFFLKNGDKIFSFPFVSLFRSFISIPMKDAFWENLAPELQSFSGKKDQTEVLKLLCEHLKNRTPTEQVCFGCIAYLLGAIHTDALDELSIEQLLTLWQFAATKRAEMLLALFILEKIKNETIKKFLYFYHRNRTPTVLTDFVLITNELTEKQKQIKAIYDLKNKAEKDIATILKDPSFADIKPVFRESLLGMRMLWSCQLFNSEKFYAFLNKAQLVCNGPNYLVGNDYERFIVPINFFSPQEKGCLFALKDQLIAMLQTNNFYLDSIQLFGWKKDGKYCYASAIKIAQNKFDKVKAFLVSKGFSEKDFQSSNGEIWIKLVSKKELYCATSLITRILTSKEIVKDFSWHPKRIKKDIRLQCGAKNEDNTSALFLGLQKLGFYKESITRDKNCNVYINNLKKNYKKVTSKVPGNSPCIFWASPREKEVPIDVDFMISQFSKKQL